jgi:hypothetical protein
MLTDARLDPSEQAIGNLHDVTDDSVYHRVSVGSN